MLYDNKAPKLTPELVVSEQQLWNTIDEASVKMPGYIKWRRRILRAQKRFKKLASRDAWSEYLKIESLTNACQDDEITYLVKWAFEEGRRTGAR